MAHKIRDFYHHQNSVFSFEFFLPKTSEDTKSFVHMLKEVKTVNPSFVTLTYGAGGSTRDQTVEMAGRIRNELGFTTMMHLTCIAHTRLEIADIAAKTLALGIEGIMALRGDVPKDGKVAPFEQREYKYAVDLVRHLRSTADFTIGVAGYPEGHPEAKSKEEDLNSLKTKVEAGADFITTQLFFNNKDYFDFCQRARAIGIKVPIVPGIMPITNFAQIQRFTSMCGASLPDFLKAKMEPIQNDREAVVQLGIEYAKGQCRELLSQGAPGIHFYTLNKSYSTQAILAQLRREGF